jgi:hypothetical protein
MKRFLTTILVLGLSAPAFATKTQVPVRELTATQRVKLAVSYARSRIKAPVFTGWNAGESKAPVVAKTGSVRVSTGDEAAPQSTNYFVTFTKEGKPKGLKSINTY